MLENSHTHIQVFSHCSPTVEDGIVTKLVRATLFLSEKCIDKL